MGAFVGAWLWRNGVRKGLLGTSRAWFIVAVVAGAVRVAKWLNGRGDQERLGLTLHPGERIELAVVEPEGRPRKAR